MDFVSNEDLCNRFVSAFNELDAVIRDRTSARKETTYASNVREFTNKFGFWASRRTDFEEFGDVRNMMVHRASRDTTGKLAFPIVPALTLVERIESAVRDITNPPLVTPRFTKPLIAVKAQDPVSVMLRHVRKLDITHFPTFDDDRFVGLINPDGIVNWLAQANAADLADLSATAQEVLNTQPEKNNYLFIARNTPLAAAFSKFREHPNVDALLITHSGSSTEKLLGIITLWDVAQVERSSSFKNGRVG